MNCIYLLISLIIDIGYHIVNPIHNLFCYIGHLQSIQVVIVIQ